MITTERVFGYVGINTKRMTSKTIGVGLKTERGKFLPLRWGRAFARLGELVCTSSTGYYYRRGANGGDLCVGVAGYWERAAADGGRMREE